MFYTVSLGYTENQKKGKKERKYKKERKGEVEKNKERRRRGEERKKGKHTGSNCVLFYVTFILSGLLKNGQV